MNLVEKMNELTEKITIDLGNANYKMLIGDKKIINNSNTEEVVPGTWGAYKVNEKHYIFGEGATEKFNTNKIIEGKKALLGKALYSVVDDNAELEITTLLPLSLYIKLENRERFKKLLQGQYTVSNPSGFTKTFNISSVNVCCEGFSSLMTRAELLQNPLYLVDIGGVDLTACYINRTPVSAQSFTSEQGMNIFYMELAKVLTATLLDTYSNKDAELLYNKYTELADDMKEIIDNFARDYVQKNIYKKLKDIGYKEIIHKLVFTGGGAKALERYLAEDVLENAMWSNVEGAEIIARRRAS